MFRAARFASTLLLLLLGAACEGDNLYRRLPTEGGASPASGGDGLQVEIQAPADSQRVAVQDSVLVRVRVRDPQGVLKVELTGVSLRGSETLGTQTQVERFLPKSVTFDSARVVRDTVVLRYLLPADDTLPDRTVLLVARATGRGGGVSADTARISIGGPRVQLLAPERGTEVRAGSPLRVQVTASSPGDRIQALVIQARGGHTADTTLRLDVPQAAVDTQVVLNIPASAQGEVRLRAVARTIANDSAVAAEVPVVLLAPVRDQRPPTVSFSVNAPARAEHDDSVFITVAATDSTQVAEVGVTVRAIHRRGTGTDTLSPAITLTEARDRHTFGFPLSRTGVPVPTDTSTLQLEVTAFARDTARNCATATVPATPLSEPCFTSGSAVFGSRPGARSEVTLVRGRTIALEAESDQILDIASNGSQVFLSNHTRNRLDVLRVGEGGISSTVSVGSRPWGLALSPDRSRLYVANSGGTNISVVSTGSLTEETRIQTPNVKLYDVAFEARKVANPDAGAGQPDSVSRSFPTTVARFDYSDRPQFIAVTQAGNLIYSTRPTGAAPTGTVRIYRTEQQRLEVVTGYAEERVAGRLVILNADSAFLVVSNPNNLLQVCPRRRSEIVSRDVELRNSRERCFVGSIEEVRTTIDSLAYDTKFLYNVDINELGLSDTTFVAVSGDHSTVAFGEGARQNGRVMLFTDRAGQPANSPLAKFGEIRDIVGNASERVIGLALNENGSLGLARGSEAFYFDNSLRLQGVVGTGSQSGGVDMRPGNTGRGLSYVSGVTAGGLAYIDVIDTFTFRSVGRIFVRDPVTGPLRAVRTSDGTVRIYAVTARGVIEVAAP